MINSKSVLAITLARGGSKGIPKKNISLIKDKPLISYTVEEVLKSKFIDKYIIATDDTDIEKACQKWKIKEFSKSSKFVNSAPNHVLNSGKNSYRMFEPESKD